MGHRPVKSTSQGTLGSSPRIPTKWQGESSSLTGLSPGDHTKTVFRSSGVQSSLRDGQRVRFLLGIRSGEPVAQWWSDLEKGDAVGSIPTGFSKRRPKAHSRGPAGATSAQVPKPRTLSRRVFGVSAWHGKARPLRGAARVRRGVRLCPGGETGRTKHTDPIAQLVERCVVCADVAGSSPTGAAKNTVNAVFNMFRAVRSVSAHADAVRKAGISVSALWGGCLVA